MNMSIIEFHTAMFALFLCSSGLPSEESWMRSHFMLRLVINCENGVTTDVKELVPNIRAEQCMLDNYVCVI